MFTFTTEVLGAKMEVECELDEDGFIITELKHKGEQLNPEGLCDSVLEELEEQALTLAAKEAMQAEVDAAMQ